MSGIKFRPVPSPWAFFSLSAMKIMTVSLIILHIFFTSLVCEKFLEIFFEFFLVSRIFRNFLHARGVKKKHEGWEENLSEIIEWQKFLFTLYIFVGIFKIYLNLFKIIWNPFLEDTKSNSRIQSFFILIIFFHPYLKFYVKLCYMSL
jgi:hypothetical protein